MGVFFILEIKMDEVEWNCTECGEYFEAPYSDEPAECSNCGSFETVTTGA